MDLLAARAPHRASSHATQCLPAAHRQTSPTELRPHSGRNLDRCGPHAKCAGGGKKIGMRKHTNSRDALWKLLVLSTFVFSLSGCSVQIDDPAVKPFASMYAVDRDQYGMSPLPKHARV